MNMYVVLLFCMLFPACIKCNLSDIVKIDDQPTIGSPVSPENAFHFMSSGVSNIFWSHVASSNFTEDTRVTTKCREALTAVSSGLSKGDILPFHFVDASAKTPTGFIRSSMTSFGDYDQCLAIDGAIEGIQMNGRYCAVDMFPVRVSLENDRKNTDTMTTGKMTFDRLSVFKRVPFIHSICVPAQCSKSDLRVTLATVLSPYQLKVTGEISCDTRDTISTSYRIASLNSLQVIALIFISGLTGLVVVSSIIHLCASLTAKFFGATAVQLPSAVSSLSIATATKNVFLCKKQPWTVVVYELQKSPPVLVAAMSHILLGLDTPLGFLVYEHYDTFGHLFASVPAQALFQESGLATLYSVTGLATGMIAFPLIKRSKLNYLAAFIDRVVRFLPGMAVMTALELLWPISGSGPLWSRVSKYMVNKCTKNWKYNFLFINNLSLEPTDICGGASYYLSVDLQLFLIGLLVLWCFSKSHKAGYLACVLFSLTSSFFVAYNIITKNIPGQMIVKNPSPHRLHLFITHIIMDTSSYIPAYLMGIASGFMIVEYQLLTFLKSLKDRILWTAVSGTLPSIAVLLSIVYNSLDLIPETFAFIVPILSRILYAVSTCTAFIVFAGLLEEGEKNSPSSGDEGKKENVHFNFWKGCSRLLFPLYLTNYIIIRYMFFSSRQSLSTHVVSLVSQVTSTLCFILIFSYLVQVLLLAPLEYGRKRAMNYLMKTKTN